jgi:hypothetical protein
MATRRAISLALGIGIRRFNIPDQVAQVKENLLPVPPKSIEPGFRMNHP